MKICTLELAIFCFRYETPSVKNLPHTHQTHRHPPLGAKTPGTGRTFRTLRRTRSSAATSYQTSHPRRNRRLDGTTSAGGFPSRAAPPRQPEPDRGSDTEERRGLRGTVEENRVTEKWKSFSVDRAPHFDNTLKYLRFGFWRETCVLASSELTGGQPTGGSDPLPAGD